MSQVIINDVPPYTQAFAILNQTVFGTNWTANYESDVIVYVTPAGDDPDDFNQILSYPSQYSVTFVGALQEVQVTLVTPSAAGDIVTITRMTPADRENLYNNTNFLPSMLNNDFGILTLVDQQAQLVNQKIGPRYNYSAVIVDVIDTILPILGANQVWGKNDSNTAIIPLNIGDISPGGTVTEIDTGLGLTGGPITVSGTISFAPMTANTFWGNITGSTAVPTMVSTSYFLISSNNLSDLPNVATARTNLGLAIGVNVEAWSPALDSIAGLTTGANNLIYTTASNTYSVIASAPSAVLITSSGSVPSLSQTLPTAVQSNITQLGAQSQALNMNSHQINNVTDPTNPQDSATKAYVDSQSGAFLPLIGGTMSGAINMGNNKIDGLADPTLSQDAVTLSYLNTQLGLYLPLAGGTMTGAINMSSHKITNLTDPTNPQDAATKNYVDNVATGFAVQPAVAVGTTIDLNAVYLNGASGIGATLTNAGALAALVIDGYNVQTNDRVLVKNQTSTLENGIYTATNVGSGAVAWILTRATDYDQPSEIQPGDLVIINNGSTQAGSSFIETASVSAIGTDPILFSQFTFSANAVLLKANNLSDVANTTTSFNNISPLTTKGDLIGFSTQNVRLAVGGTNNQILQVNSGAATGLSWSTATYPSTTTINQILYSNATNTVTGLSTLAGGVLVTDASSVPQFLTNPGVAGKVLQSANSAIPAWSTPTYPSASGTSGKFIISDGTNNVYSTSTIPTSAGSTAGKIIVSDGTNYVLSTPTFPNASATTGKIIISDGTNWIASTPTYPATAGTSGNVLTSDGTNWVSSTPATITPGLINQLAWYAASGNTISGLSTANNGVLVTNGSGVPSISSTLPDGLNLQTPLITNIKDSNGNLILGLLAVSSGVNYLRIQNNTTGNFPVLASVGSDSAVGMLFQTKNSDVWLTDGTSTIAPSLRWYNAAGTHYTAFKAATSQSTDATFVLPAADGTANFPLKTDGSGNLSFAAIAPAAVTGTAVTNCKVGTFTFDLSSANGSTSVVSTLTFTPKSVIFMGGVNGSSCVSMNGFDDGTTKGSVSDDNVDSGATYAVSTAQSIVFARAAGANQQGHITTLASNGFTVTWTKTGSPTGTATIIYMAFG